MRCPSCGGEMPARSRFCSWCGAPAPIEAWAAGSEHGDVPDWRRDASGWLLLHMAIGLLGLWAVQLSFVALAAAAEGARVALHPVHILPAATGLSGWFLFVYLRRALAVRWTGLVAFLVLGVALTVAFGRPA